MGGCDRREASPLLHFSGGAKSRRMIERKGSLQGRLMFGSRKAYAKGISADGMEERISGQTLGR